MNRLYRVAPAPLIAACTTLLLLLTGCGPNLFRRMASPRWGFFGTIIIILDIIALIDLLGDKKRETGDKILWTLLIVFMPLLGCLLYYWVGRE
ncbi:PLD nuclease N-terminal domain-containing protein [Salisaeta longa]|uniref:PLD nuclease N-terminal domain-containing protein n=1 Tax=Salisaeta longa TaxID=503170 RepID=UPI0003B77659|nr:PLD nuclease N-terminal domain-containing protein [Salisaeta longa]